MAYFLILNIIPLFMSIIYKDPYGTNLIIISHLSRISQLKTILSKVNSDHRAIVVAKNIFR
jgi:hypothetical protein